MKKFVILCTIVCMICISTNPLYASTKVNEESIVDSFTRERVYGEMVSGNITNEEDVLKVAVEQYWQRKSIAIDTLDAETEYDDGSFSITQSLGSYIDEDGNVNENILSTGLIVLDEDNNLVRISEVSNPSGNATFSEYNIYATMTVNMTIDKQKLQVHFNSFKTRLTYGTAMKAGKLIQGGWHAETLTEFYSETEKTYANPDANKDYQFVPSYKQMVTYENVGTGAQAYSKVMVGSKGIGLSFTVQGKPAAPDGEWITEYY